MMTITGIPDLRQQPFFASLPRHEWVYLQSRLVRHDLEPGSVLVAYGERGDFYALLGRGRVSLESATGDVQILERGGTLGEGMLRYGVPSTVTAKAITPCSIWVLQRADWLAARQMVHVPASAPADSASAGSAQKGKRRFRFNVLFWTLAVSLLVILALAPSLMSLLNRGVVRMAYRLERPDLAADYLRYALYWQPGEAALHDALGYAYFMDTDLPQAEVQFQKALSLDDEMATAQNNLGVTLLAQGQVQAAIPYLVNATVLAPGNAHAYYNLGNAYLAAGLPQAAAPAYQRAFMLDASQLEARAHWAAIMVSQGKLSQARLTWNEVLVVDPNQPLARKGLGALALLEGRPAAALPDLLTAVQIDPSDPETHYYLGLAFEALGRPDEAYAAFEQALALSQNMDLKSLAQAHLQDLQLKQQLPPGSSFQKGGASQEAP